jgi:ankyrin repeat protein
MGNLRWTAEPTRRSLAVAAGCAALIALAACGSADEPGASTSSGAATATAGPAPTTGGDPALAAALLEAALAGDATEVKRLLSDGAVPDIGAAQAIIFGEKDDPSLLDVLFDAGLDPNLAETNSPEHTILMWTAEAGHPKMTKAALDAGARIDQVDGYGDPAISVAAFVGELDIVKLLLAHGAALDLRGLGDRNAVQHARSQGNDAIADYLVRHGAPE